MIKTCLQCGTAFKTWPAWIRKGGGKFCSRACSVIAQTGPGITTHTNGYPMTRKPEHPHANPYGWVYDHILIAEETLGRQLTPDEVVHHKDGNPSNNEPNNLQVLPNLAEHTKLHARLRALARGIDPDTQRYCPHCQQVLPRTSFGPTVCRGQRCIAAYCRPCYAQLQQSIRDKAKLKKMEAYGDSRSSN